MCVSVTLTAFVLCHFFVFVCGIFLFCFLVSPHVSAWVRAKHFGCHSVILSVSHNGNSLSDLQT